MSARVSREALEKTQYANEYIVFDFGKTRYKSIEGRALIFGEEPMDGALVEIFAYAGPLENYADDARKRRLAACVTSENGQFAFSLPSGRYELRVSHGGGWNATHVIVVVDREFGKQKKLDVPMRVGT
jgi:hypothetical protein